MKRGSCWFLIAALSVPLAAVAETAYVTDDVTVGLRADVTPDATVVKTLSTGAALEVIERSGAFARVRDSDGAEGWLEATALSTQLPAALQLKSVRAELDRTRAQLVNAQTQLDKARMAAAPSPELDKLRAELTTARSELTEAQAQLKQKDEQLAAAAAAPRPTVESAPPSNPEAPSGTEFSVLWLVIAFAMLVLGFIGGIVWVRESIRRRMGGLYLRI